jgi:hypothetical protein
LVHHQDAFCTTPVGRCSPAGSPSARFAKAASWPRRRQVAFSSAAGRSRVRNGRADAELADDHACRPTTLREGVDLQLFTGRIIYFEARWVPGEAVADWAALLFCDGHIARSSAIAFMVIALGFRHFL